MILQNASILHADGRFEKKRNIHIEGGKICKIMLESEEKQLAALEETEEIIDCSHYVISPGLINMHTHAAMNIFKGIAEDVSSNRWFNEIIWPYESKMQEEDAYIGTRLAIAEMIQAGVTTFADHYFYEKAVYQAVEETGIRSVIAPTLFGSAPSFENRFSEVVSFMERKKGRNERVELRMGPHAPYTCPGETLRCVIQEAKKLGVGIHLHVSENAPQVEKCIAETGKTPFGVIEEAGGFDVPCLVAHGSYIRKEDLIYLKADTWFATCPKTYMKLASGIGNLYQYRKQIQFSFGSDGAASSNTLNPLEEAQLFALIGKYYFGNCEEYTNKEIWRALMDGHKAFGFHSGQIAEGWNADLIIWDLEKVNTYPVYDPICSILYSADTTNVCYTMVDGMFLKKKGKILLDTEGDRKKAKESQKNLLARGKGKAIVVY